MPRLCTRNNVAIASAVFTLCLLLAGFSFNTVAILFILEFDNFAYVSHPDNCWHPSFCGYDLRENKANL